MGFTSIQNLVADNGSVANFKAWAMAISAFFTTCGWTRTTDTGQVSWSTGTVVAITAASFSGGNTTYTYTLTSGTPLLVGQVPVITGMAAGGNNGTFTITALTGTLLAGTFTVVNASGVNATLQSGTGTAPFVVPNGTTVFEIWQPSSDPLQTGATAYFLKIQYGNSALSSNSPEVIVTISTTTNGGGTPTGLIAGPYTIPFGSVAGQGAITFECDFCGDIDRIGIMLWRNNSNAGQCGAFFIERTKTTSGTNSSDGVTLFNLGGAFALNQRTIEFGVGLGPPTTTILAIDPNLSVSTVFNNSAPISPTFALYGKFGNPQTVLQAASRGDVIEGMLLTTTLYGATRTYLASKNGAMSTLGASNGMAALMRWD